MERFDAIVVGAGPAGSTAAYRLARAGTRVLLLDKARFPRDKPCGGAISTRATRQLPFDLQPVAEDVIDRMELSYRGGRPFIRGKRTRLAYMTQRRLLDHFLVEQAIHAGARFHDGAIVTDITERGARVSGRWIDSQLLIGADGANGTTARSLNLADKRIYGVALEGNLPHDFTDPKRWRHTVVIEFGTIPGGYCWIFPKGDHINIGVGGWENTGPTLRRHLKAFCRRRGFDHSKLQDLRGYRLPARRPHASLAHSRALLVGDAAGLVDPLWGDGIYTALTSSKHASVAALDLLAGRTPDLNPYTQAIMSELGPTIAFAWDMKAALDRYPRLTLAGLLSPPGWRIAENLLRGKISKPDTEQGSAGLALRVLQTFGQRWGSSGSNYRAETETTTSST